MALSEAEYHHYIDAFNARDYATLETYFTDDFILENAGFKIQGKSEFRAFYAFFHDYFKETVIFRGFYPGTEGFVANVTIRFEGMKDLTPEILAEKGFAGMTPVGKGDCVDLEFLILYVMNDAGLIRHIKGAVWVPAP
ncbi:MAG: nuclear transport factor 2 family protein [Sphingobium sp.]|nr:nuclear transport factor 2 family protein [Sphingobium sp.]